MLGPFKNGDGLRSTLKCILSNFTSFSVVFLKTDFVVLTSLNIFQSPTIFLVEFSLLHFLFFSSKKCGGKNSTKGYVTQW